MSTLTAERLRELLDYDPATGVFRWKVRASQVAAGTIAGSVSQAAGGYRQIKINRTLYTAHRLAWLYVHGEWPSGTLDHKDTCGDHNWIDNLRPATDSQNQGNRGRPRNNTSGFKGASFSKYRRKWQALIQFEGRLKHLGYFDTPEAAHAAYAASATRLFGEFARVA